MLTTKQVDHYQSEGYVVLERAVAESALVAIRQAARDIVDDFDINAKRTVFSTTDRDRGRDRYFMESSEAVHCFLEEDALDEHGGLVKPKHLAINKIGHALHDLVPAFSDFCRLPLFAGILADLGLRSPTLWQSMYIFKQPHIGGEVRWHQDASYLNADPGVIGMWVAVEDAHRDNGCLWMQPGGHRSPLREIYEVDPQSHSGTLRTLNDTPWPSESDATAVEVAAGGVVVFSDCMPHYSSQNRSGRSRQAFTMHFAERDARWSRTNWLQRPHLAPFTVAPG